MRPLPTAAPPEGRRFPETTRARPADYHAPSLIAPTTEPIPGPTIWAWPARPNPSTSLDGVLGCRLLLSPPQACLDHTPGPSPGAGTGPPRRVFPISPTTCPPTSPVSPRCWMHPLRSPSRRPQPPPTTTPRQRPTAAGVVRALPPTGGQNSSPLWRAESADAARPFGCPPSTAGNGRQDARQSARPTRP